MSTIKKRAASEPREGRLQYRKLTNATIVLIGAVASIATSAARWQIAATPVAKASNGKGQLVTVESSAQPNVTVENGSIAHRLLPEESAVTWPGRTNYFVAPSETLKSVEVVGFCSSFCSKCEPPPNAYARIISSVDVESWVLDASSSAPVNLDFSTPDADNSFQVVVLATRPPALEIKPTAPIAAKFYVSEPRSEFVDPKDPQVITKRYTFRVGWQKENPDVTGEFPGAWTAKATISGYCRQAGPCVAPASEHVTIESVQGPTRSSTAPTAPAFSSAAPDNSAGR